MPKSSNPLNLAVAALLAVMAVPCMILGVVGLFTAGEIAWVFGLLAAGGAMMIAGAIQSVIRWRKAVAEEEATTYAMIQAINASRAAEESRTFQPSEASPGVLPDAAPFIASAGASAVGSAAARGRMPEPVLAHWTYEPAEWAAYAQREAAYRTREAIGVGAGVAALGTLFVGLTEGDWGLGFAISAAVGGIIGLGRWGMARSARASNLAGPSGEVIIAPNAILLNGRYEVLQDHHFHFGGVRYVEDERPPLLEFTVTWKTGNGPTNEQYRVPVPSGREDEAHALVDTFRRIHSGALAG